MTTSSTPPSPLLLTRALDLHGRYLGDKPAITGTDHLTYGELASLVDQVRTWAVEQGLAGQRVALMLRPSAGHLAFLLGLLASQAVACPVNVRLSPPERELYLSRLSPALTVADPTNTMGGTNELIVDLEDPSVPLSRRLPVPSRPLALTMPSLADEHAAAIAFPTGGTTGVPKAGLWSHRSLLLALQSSCQHLEVRRDDIELYFSPFFHLTIVTGILSTLLAGGTVRLLGLYDEERVAGALSTVGATRMFGTPAALERLAAIGPRVGWPSLRSVIYGASRSWPDLPTRLSAAFPSARLFTGYGATEFGAVTRLYHEDVVAGLDSVGRPVAGVELRVVDKVGRPVPVGEEGELLVRSPWQMLGYLGDTHEQPFLEGAVRSGDIVRLRADGHLVLIDRRNDVIKSGGEAVYPSEVEEVLRSLPGVVDAAVFGQLDQTRGERVEAAVVADSGVTLDPDALRAAAAMRLVAYKVPRRIHVVDALPLTSNLKLDRRKLRSDLE